MVEIEEIEDYYKKGTEELDKDFLKSLSKGIEKSRIEKEYHDKILLLLKSYNEKYKEYKEKERLMDSLAAAKEEKIEHLKIKKTIFRLSLREKISGYVEKNSFKLKLKIRNLSIKIAPKTLVRLIIKIRLRLKLLKISFNDLWAKSSERVHSGCDAFKERVKEMQSKIESLLVKTPDNKN